MQVDIISPEKKLYQGSAKSVQAQGSTGWFEVLNNHAPFVSTLEPCAVRVISDDDTEKFVNDVEANAMLKRPQRAPYGVNNIKGI